MLKLFNCGLLLAGAVVSVAVQSTELAPYFYAWGFEDSAYAASGLMVAKNAGGVVGVTIAFGIARGGCTLDSDMGSLLANDQVADDVTAFLHHGGRVIFSFGGQVGVYLESVCSATGLAKLISQLLDKYQVYAIDFDIEGAQLSNAALNKTRNNSILLLQQRYPRLYVSFTLPVEQDVGLSEEAVTVLRSATQAGVKLSIINIMVMDYNAGYTNLGQQAVLTANATFKQLKSIFKDKSAKQLWSMLGITPMIGNNDSRGEVFSQKDASIVADFAKQKNIGLLSYWALQRDQVGTGGHLDTYSRINTYNYEFYKLLSEGTK